jgi:hypothetical protein
MVDRKFVLKWAHLGRGRPRPPEHRKIIEEERRAFKAHVDEIYAEQEQCNTKLAARMAAVSGRRLMVVPRYAKRSR